MNQNERQRLTQAVAMLCEAFGKAPSEVTFLTWEMGLDDLPIERIERACREASAECRFMPVIAEIRERAGVLAPEARAALAWRAWDHAFVRHGGVKSLKLDDPVTMAVVDNLGGLARFTNASVEEFDKWLRREFERLYVQFLRSGYVPRVTRLVGEYERANALHGHEHDTTEQIAMGLPALPTSVRIGGPISEPAKPLAGVTIPRVEFKRP